jgi:hypothetical protein
LGHPPPIIPQTHLALPCAPHHARLSLGPKLADYLHATTTARPPPPTPTHS